MNQNTLLRTLPMAMFSAIVGTWIVHGRTGDETFVCDTGRCSLGSGASWLLTGVTLVAPSVMIVGFLWSRRLHHQGTLGPFAYRPIPDAEQIIEVLGVLAAGVLAWLIATRGPTIEAVEVNAPNSWFEGRVRAEDPTGLVPARRSWFAIGAVLSAPFAFSLGSMFGREWYARVRRRSQPATSGDEKIDLRYDTSADHEIDQP